MSEASSTTRTKSYRDETLSFEHSFTRPGQHQQTGAFPFPEGHMNTALNRLNRGFSMIELVIVVTILGIITAIAVPKFADAATGRKLQAGKKQLLADIETAKLRARATSKQHTLKFYPSEEIYVIVEGNEITREAIVIARDFSEEPFDIDLNRTNLGGDQVMVITAFGDISPSGRVQLRYSTTALTVDIEGVADTGIVPVVTATEDEVKGVVEELVGGVLGILK